MTRFRSEIGENGLISSYVSQAVRAEFRSSELSGQTIDVCEKVARAADRAAIRAIDEIRRDQKIFETKGQSMPPLPTPANGGSETGDCPHLGRKGHEVYARPDGSSHCRACGAEWPPSPTSEGDEQ